MTKLSECLIILNFIGLKIEYLNNVHINYGFTDLLTGIKNDMYRKLYNLGVSEEILDSEKYRQFIAEEASEKFSLVHENFAKGIVDLYSFKQEYDDFFNSKCTENEFLREKILKFKKDNKHLINDLDWNEIIDLRNTILAHNLRDKNKSLANRNLTKFALLSLDYKKGLLYFIQMNTVYQNLKKDFGVEFQQAFIESIM
ncbi:hypothetical protein [Chryseobacterium wanjuense]